MFSQGGAYRLEVVVSRRLVHAAVSCIEELKLVLYTGLSTGKLVMVFGDMSY